MPKADGRGTETNPAADVDDATETNALAGADAASNCIVLSLILHFDLERTQAAFLLHSSHS